MGMYTRQRGKTGEFEPLGKNTIGKFAIIVVCFSDTREYALKQIEGTGLSMSACR